MSKVRILSPRPEINKNVAFYATFLFILVGFRFKRQNFLSGSNLSLGTVCLRGIRDDFAALYLQNLLIVAPTRDK